jgi:hypothetical protein
VPFTAKEVYRRHWRALDLDGTRAALQVLIDYGHIREKEADPLPIGRPSVRYEVHPAIRRASA